MWPSSSVSHEVCTVGTVGMCKGYTKYCGPMFDIYIYVFYLTSTVIMPQYGRPGHLHTVGMVRYGTVATHSKGIACAIYIKEEQMRTLAQP